MSFNSNIYLLHLANVKDNLSTTVTIYLSLLSITFTDFNHLSGSYDASYFNFFSLLNYLKIDPLR